MNIHSKLLFFALVCQSTLFSQSIFLDYDAPLVPLKNIQNKTESVAKDVGYEKSSSCSNSSEASIPFTSCSEVGSSAYGNNSISSSVDYTSGASFPNSPACFNGSESEGNWSVFDLDSGVESVMIEYESNFSIGGGADDIRMAFYQGSDCNNLTEVGCGSILVYYAGYGYVPNDLVIDGLDDTQQLWVFTAYEDTYTMDVILRGFATQTNTSCPDATSQAIGCNLGAMGATGWTGPTDNGVTCSGGTWYSNENTVYYTFTATSSDATLEVNNVTCNDGTNGEAQFAVWENCGDVGDYSSGFMGCAVGTGTLTMSSLSVGSNYVLVMDGQAGDVCTWGFVSSGIILPTELINLNAVSLDGYNRIYWSTVSEVNSDYFIVEKSIDGYEFETIGTVKSAGSSQSLIDYSFNDYEQRNETVYYRLKQIDQNGEFEYHGPIPLDFIGKDKLSISPNPVNDYLSINYPFKKNVSYIIRLRDLSGRDIIKITKYNNSFLNHVLVETSSLKKGVYVLSVESIFGFEQQTIIK